MTSRAALLGSTAYTPWWDWPLPYQRRLAKPSSGTAIIERRSGERVEVHWEGQKLRVLSGDHVTVSVFTDGSTAPPLEWTKGYRG